MTFSIVQTNTPVHKSLFIKRFQSIILNLMETLNQSSESTQNPNPQQQPISQTAQPNNHSVLPIVLIILGVFETFFSSFYLINLIIITPKLK